jgi:flavodoxin
MDPSVNGGNMNIRVLYHSLTGNTRRIAEAIAEEAGCATEKTTGADPALAADILFLGAALHKGGLDESLVNRIRGMDPLKIKGVAVFVTCINEIAGEKAMRMITALLRGRGLRTIGSGFACRGKFLFFNRKQPDSAAIDRAKAFARAIVRGDR